MKLPIYMDYHATTPLDPAVLEAMWPYYTTHFGNAGSRTHSFGVQAADAVDVARKQVAALIGASSKEIFFTSGATEANNLAIFGTASQHKNRRAHIITTPIEHKSVLDPCRQLAEEGFRISLLPVDSQGLISLQDLQAALTPDTILISVMFANNEIGTIQPLAEIGALAKEHGILFHTDATQGVGKIPVNVKELQVDLLSLTAHKICGPKGIGALYVRRYRPRVKLTPIQLGGGQESGLRPGTLNVPGIVGLGAACAVCRKTMEEEAIRLSRLRDRLYRGITSRLDHVQLNGHPVKRLPGNLNLGFRYVEGESLMMSLEEIALSSGSACTSTSLEPSYVLKAIGVEDELAHSSIRFGLGRFTTEEEVDFTVGRVAEEVQRLRELSPQYHLAREAFRG